MISVWVSDEDSDVGRDPEGPTGEEGAAGEVAEWAVALAPAGGRHMEPYGPCLPHGVIWGDIESYGAISSHTYHNEPYEPYGAATFVAGIQKLQKGWLTRRVPASMEIA